MKRFSTTLCAAALALSPAAASHAWHTSDAGAQSSQQQGRPAVNAPKPPPAPASVKAKYEGGVAGYGKSEGTLNFDDANRRLVFRDKKGKELFSVPYEVVHAAWADARSQTATAGRVIAGTVPYGLGLPGLLVKNKTRYLNLQYRDPNTRAEGAASFKLEDRQTLASVLHTFAEKAGLTQRGDHFVRRTAPAVTTTVSDN